MRFNMRQDLVGGSCVLLVGLGAAIHTATSYDIGTPASMGPGFFPLSLGILLTGFGLWICASAWRSRPVEVVIELRPFLAILLAIAAFGLILPAFGLIPAVLALVIISLLAEDLPGTAKTSAIAAVIIAIAVLIFRVGLNIPLPIVNWPF